MTVPSTDLLPVVKIMTLSEPEFWKSLQVLDQVAAASKRLPARLQLVPGHVDIGFVADAPVTLGGLLVLPRARVSLDFHGVSSQDRARFLARFDTAFQRGGG